MHKYLFRKYVYFLCYIFIFILKVNADEINSKKEHVFKQYLSQIIWEKVYENNQKPLKWKIDENQNSVNFESNFRKNLIDKKRTLPSSSFLLNKEKINLDIGLMNDGSDFYFLNLGLSRAFSINFSSELINAKDNVNNANKFKSTFLEKGSRNFRGGATFQVFSQSKGGPISTNIRLSYGEKSGGLRHGYIFSEIINKYSISEWLSFNVNPKFSFTSFGNVYSIRSSIHWRLNPKFEIIPETNINLNNAENNFYLTGRTYLSKNIIIDTFVSNSFGVNDMANQFKSENTKYGVNLKMRL